MHWFNILQAIGAPLSQTQNQNFLNSLSEYIMSVVTADPNIRRQLFYLYTSGDDLATEMQRYDNLSRMGQLNEIAHILNENRNMMGSSLTFESNFWNVYFDPNGILRSLLNVLSFDQINQLRNYLDTDWGIIC